NLNCHFYNLITSLIFSRVEHAFFPKPELLPVLCSRRNLELGAPIDGGHFDLGPETGFGHRYGHANLDVVAATMKEGMLFDARCDVQIACRSAQGTRVSFSRHAQTRPV